MKTLIASSLILLSFQAFAVDYGYLKPEDQKYYKNDTMEGNNGRERTDSLVKEVNKLYGEINSLKSEVQQLKSDVEELKKRK